MLRFDAQAHICGPAGKNVGHLGSERSACESFQTLRKSSTGYASSARQPDFADR